MDRCNQTGRPTTSIGSIMGCDCFATSPPHILSSNDLWCCVTALHRSRLLGGVAEAGRRETHSQRLWFACRVSPVACPLPFFFAREGGLVCGRPALYFYLPVSVCLCCVVLCVACMFGVVWHRGDHRGVWLYGMCVVCINRYLQPTRTAFTLMGWMGEVGWVR